MITRRVERVAALLKRELSKLTYEALPEDLGMATITEVFLSSDLKEAKVYVSCLKENSQKEIIKKLQAKAKDFQRILGRNLRMRYTPKIIFKVDQGLDEVRKIDELLKQIDPKRQK